MSIRIWSNSVFLNALSDERAVETKWKIVDQFYKRYEEDIAENPENHSFGAVNMYIHVMKEGN